MFLLITPLFLVTGLHLMFGTVPVTVVEKLVTVLSALPNCAILNTLFLVALQVFSAKEGRDASVFKRRLLMVGYYSVLLFLNYSYVFEAFGLKESDGSITHSIYTALYFTAVTWTTVGYGDVVPHDSFTRLFAALAALNGYAVLGVWIAVLVPIFTTDRENPA